MPDVLSLASKTRVESAIHPGVFFVLRKRTEGRRIQLRLKMAPVQRELEEALAEVRACGEAPYAGTSDEDLTPEQRIERTAWIEASQPALDRYFAVRDDKVHPAWVEWGLDRVEGLDIDGEKITGANAVELLPEELYEELLGHIKATAGLGEAQAKN